MIRPYEYRVLGRGFQDGIPCVWLEDFNGKHWVSLDFECLRRRYEDSLKRQPVNDCNKTPYHKRKLHPV